MTPPVDDIFGHPRLAAVYDALDPDRSDLEPYLLMAEAYQARRVLDVGCGTGTFALLLADRGHEVTGVDPASASLDIARAKPGADRVRWIDGSMTDVPETEFDLVTMTGNVAQAVVDAVIWRELLVAVRSRLAVHGRLIFESRDPSARAWERWNRRQSESVTDIPRGGSVRSWVDVLRVDGPVVTFRWTYEFTSDNAVLTSDSTIRFRGRDEIEADLAAAGFIVDRIADAPDRPGLESVFIVRGQPR